MSDATATAPQEMPQGLWGMASLKAAPMTYLGRCLVMFLRYFNGIFYFAAGVNKIRQEWLWTDRLKLNFEQRITELPPDSFAHGFLEYFGIPMYIPIAFVVFFGEIITGTALLLGLCTRAGAILAVIINFLFGIGGYYDASLIALTSLLIPVIFTRNGHWVGMDRKLHAKYPDKIWFK